MSPRILLNDNLGSSNFLGMKRYFRQISAGIAAAWGKDVWLYGPDALPPSQARHLPALTRGKLQPLRLNQAIVSLLMLVARPRILFNAFYAAFPPATARVYTLYDMIPERFPDLFDPTARSHQRFMAEKRRCVEGAALCFAISAATAADALALYPKLEADRVVVTPLGVDAEFFAPPPVDPALAGKPFFLFVGRRGQYKNFDRLLAAFALSGLAAEFDLRVLSSGPLSPQEQARVAELGISGAVQVTAQAPDSVLRQHYAAATALVYPSRYEGFGLPIVEAMASGTLVATANVSSMPEVGGEVAFYFDPNDTEEMAAVLRRVAELPAGERAARVAAGRVRAQTFTWPRTVEITLAALARLA